MINIREMFRLKDLFAALIIGIAISILIVQFVQVTKINGSSMEPTLAAGSVNILNKCAYLFEGPEYGDIIAISEDYIGEVIVKRVIALPGDTIGIKDGEVYLNNQLIFEEYTKEHYTTTGGKFNEVTLEKNKYFVLGDNRNMSLDSRDIGEIDRNEILGKLVFVK